MIMLGFLVALACLALAVRIMQRLAWRRRQRRVMLEQLHASPRRALSLTH